MADAKRLPPAEFLTSLSSLFTSAHDSNHGSVFITQKPLFPSSTTDPAPKDHTQPAPQILIRATNGASPRKNHSSSSTSTKGPTTKAVQKKTPAAGTTTSTRPKVKISTVIEANDIEDFFAKLAECCKTGMGGLRKRDRRKGKKAKKAKGGGK